MLRLATGDEADRTDAMMQYQIGAQDGYFPFADTVAACSMVFRLRPQRLFSADDVVGGGGVSRGIDFRRSATAYEATAGDFYAKGYINNDGTVALNFRLKTYVGGQEVRFPGLKGKEQFNAILDHFGRDNVTAISGYWVEGDNLNAFNRLTGSGWSNEDAAANVWTGQQATGAGYTKVSVSALPKGRLGKYRSVTVLFEKP